MHQKLQNLNRIRNQLCSTRAISLKLVERMPCTPGLWKCNCTSLDSSHTAWLGRTTFRRLYSTSDLKYRCKAARASLARASLVEWPKMAYLGSRFGLFSWLGSSRPCSLELSELDEQRMHQKCLSCARFDEVYLKCNKTTKHQTKRKILNIKFQHNPTKQWGQNMNKMQLTSGLIKWV